MKNESEKSKTIELHELNEKQTESPELIQKILDSSSETITYAVNKVMEMAENNNGSKRVNQENPQKEDHLSHSNTTNHYTGLKLEVTINNPGLSH